MAVLTHKAPAAQQQCMVTPTEAKTMNVLVKWNGGKTLCLQAQAHMRVAELAVLIWIKAQAQQTAVVSRDFCMVCRGKVLDTDDDRALVEIVGGSASQMDVQVWTRQRGGCFMISCSILGIILAAIVGSTCTCGLSLLIVPVLLPLLFILPLCCL